jgi:hypothetical protein
MTPMDVWTPNHPLVLYSTGEVPLALDVASHLRTLVQGRIHRMPYLLKR